MSMITLPKKQQTHPVNLKRSLLNTFYEEGISPMFRAHQPPIQQPQPSQFCLCPTSISELPGLLVPERNDWSWGSHLPFFQLLLIIPELSSDLIGRVAESFPVVFLEVLHYQPAHLGQQLLKSPHLGPQFYSNWRWGTRGRDRAKPRF